MKAAVSPMAVCNSNGIELLAPAGDPVAFDAALAAGADAIYVGLDNAFNARRSATNFNEEEFARAATKAHLAGTLVFVTMNVLIKDKELPAALEWARRAWVLGADALIIQDWGLLKELRLRWPQIECHASTQMAIMDSRGCLFAAAQGISRVTLARELSLSEIQLCAKTQIPIEVFGHGALCFSYSGLCHMSALGGKRSANRGMCAQPCRIPYTLRDADGLHVSASGNDRPLCPRDLRTDSDLEALSSSLITSLKIEGRMKASEYVYAVTSAYRDALDDLSLGMRNGGEQRQALGEQKRNTLLQRAFNRDFTDAYLHGRSGDELMSYERSNNRGELVGVVTHCRNLGRKTIRRIGSKGGRLRVHSSVLAEVTIDLDAPVGKGDLLELRPIVDSSQYVTARMPHDYAAGERATLQTTKVVPVGSLVRVIRSQAALEAVRAVRTSCPRKRMVDMTIRCRINQPLEILLTTRDGTGHASASGDIVDVARTRAVTKEELSEHACRLGGTAFQAQSVTVELDEHAGVPFSMVHHTRARAVALLEDSLLSTYTIRDKTTALAPSSHDLSAHLRHLQTHDGITKTHNSQRADLCVLVSDAAVARTVAENGATHIYALADVFGEVQAAISDIPCIPWLDEICRESDHARLDPLVMADKPVCVGNVSELALALEQNAEPELSPCIPVHNRASLLAFEQLGIRSIWLSGELSLPELTRIASVARVGTGLVVYGFPRAMTSEHCILQARGNCTNDCIHCSTRRKAHYLEGPQNTRYRVTTDLQGRSRVWTANPIDLIAHIDEILASGVSRLMIDARLLTSQEACKVLIRVISALHRSEKDEKLNNLEPHTENTGHLFSEVL